MGIKVVATPGYFSGIRNVKKREIIARNAPNPEARNVAAGPIQIRRINDAPRQR
jgi:hypothetical protein